MIVLVDNYDSFSYNLYQQIGQIQRDVEVVRNDAVTAEELLAMEPDAVVLSPGPGRPENAGVCQDAVRLLCCRVPLLGVCLGHQAICQALGATVTYARELMHGKTSEVEVDGASTLFAGLGPTERVARYHSLAVDSATLPACLRVTAHDAAGEVMAVEHENGLLFGVQFHPESVMTEHGNRMMQNFLALAAK